jgi:YesN/AraC family two-component response regulator
VEDEYETREQTAMILRRNFDVVFIASNGKEGLDIYKSDQPDLVITDIKMPVMDGIEMIQKIREINPDQTVMVVSAYDFSDMLKPFLSKEVNFFLSKPFHPGNLFNAINELCVRQSGEEESPDDTADKEAYIRELEAKIAALEETVKKLEQRLLDQ